MLLWPRFPGSMSTPHVGELCQTQTQIGGPWFVRLGKSSARACFRSAPPRIKFAVSATTRNNLRVARDRRRHLADMAFWLPEFSKVHKNLCQREPMAGEACEALTKACAEQVRPLADVRFWHVADVSADA